MALRLTTLMFWFARKFRPSKLPSSEMCIRDRVDSIAAYNNSANAIGFSVYYYIDQMYSQPGLRLLAVDGVTPSNDSIASESYRCV